MQQLAKRPLAYSYVRMSTMGQIKGDSLRRQMEWSQAYAEKQGLELQDFDQFRDIGVSAWKGKNRSKGKLGEFIRKAQDGIIPSGSYLLVESLDRLSRMTVMDALALFQDILRAGITVVTMGRFGGPEEVYTWDSMNGDFGQLIITLTTMVRANEESERKSQRIRTAYANKRELARQGQKTNQRPPLWITPTQTSKGVFEYHLNDHAPLVREIFERSAEGIGFDRIANDLNEKGQQTVRDSKKGWWHSTIRQIVTNRAAIGEYQPFRMEKGARVPDGDPISNFYPSVVSNDLWLKAQKLQYPRKRAGRKGATFSNILDGLAECVQCRSPMYIMNSTRNKNFWQYMVCSAYSRKLTREVEENGQTKSARICTEGNGRFSYKKLELNILDNIVDFGTSELVRMKRMESGVQEMDEKIAKLTVELSSLRLREQRLENILETEDGDDIPGLLARLKARTKERQAVEESLSELTHSRDVMIAQQIPDDPATVISSLRKSWEEAEDDIAVYGLRVRCNSAMREVFDYVDFDSRDMTYTVIMYGGLRAYKFREVKYARADKAQKPLVVDAARLLLEVPLGTYVDTKGPNASGDMMEKFAKVEKAQKVAPKQGGQAVNDLLVRARNKLHGRAENDSGAHISSEKTDT